MTRDRAALVSGFGPFLDVDTNPSELVARRLDGRHVGDVVVHARVLPVSYEGAPTALADAISELEPVCVIALGAGHGPAIALEERARNLASSPQPDAAGVVLSEYTLTPGAGSTRECALPVSEWARTLSSANYPVVASGDAGRYVCNATYFALLGREGLESRSLFVHLPRRTDEASIDAAARVVLGLVERMTPTEPTP